MLLRIYIFIFACLIATASFALEQQARSWSGIDISGDLKDPWIYDLNTQARYNFTEQRYQTTRSEAGLGYKITPDVSLWIGYNWLVENIAKTQQHRIWEQVLWDIVKNDTIEFNSRTRLEQRKDINEAQWSTRFRQRLQLTFPKKICNTLTPIVFDEIFLNFNNPAWVNSHFVDQNRAFIGLGIPLAKKLEIQIGYINQYEFRDIENRMNHIVYTNLNLKI